MVTPTTFFVTDSSLSPQMRDGAHSCSGIVRTPLGTAPAQRASGSFDDQITYRVSQRTACLLNKACFAVSIIGAFLFLVTAAMQVALVRHHKKEKRYGPSKFSRVPGIDIC